MKKYILIIDKNINIDSIVIDLNKEFFVIKKTMQRINCISGECDPVLIDNIKRINGILQIREDSIYSL